MKDGIAKGGSANWGTPAEVAEMIRKWHQNGIVLDPCSTPEDNRHVQASEIYTEDGLREWPLYAGIVYVNPPGPSTHAGLWFDNAIQYARKHRTPVVLMVFNPEILRFIKEPIEPLLQPHVYVFRKRISFRDPAAKGRTHPRYANLLLTLNLHAQRDNELIRRIA